MAITLSQQPQDYMPAFNPQVFVGLSNQLAQPNFSYTIIVTDAVTTRTVTYDLPPWPSGHLVWDGKVFAKDCVKTEFVHLLTGWQVFGAVTQLNVSFGETYGSPPTFHAGPTINYKIWNGVLDFLQMPLYSDANYIYDASLTIGGLNYFCGVTNDVTFPDRSSYLYVLSDQGTTPIARIKIKTYDSAGNLLGTSQIANPYSVPGSIPETYVSIDIGHKGLSLISAGSVTGTYPIITPQVARYEVIDSSFAVTPEHLIKTFEVRCEPRYDVQTVHYLAKNGGFGTINFSKVSEGNKAKVINTSYSSNPNVFDPTAGTYGFPYWAATKKDLDITTQKKLVLRTDWITDEMITKFEECFDSPILYLDRGANRYIRLRSISNNYETLPHYSKRLVQLEKEFEYAFEDYRQTI